MSLLPDSRCPAELVALLSAALTFLPVWVCFGRGWWVTRASIALAAAAAMLPLQAYQPFLFFGGTSLASFVVLVPLAMRQSAVRVDRARPMSQKGLLRRLDFWIGIVVGLLLVIVLQGWAVRVCPMFGTLESFLFELPVFVLSLLVAAMFGDRIRMGLPTTRPVEVTLPGESGSNYRIRDAMVALGLLGLLFAMGGYAQRRDPVVNWQVLTLAGSLVVVTTVSAAAAVLCNRMRWRLVAVTSFAVTVSIASRYFSGMISWLSEATTYAFIPGANWGKTWNLVLGVYSAVLFSLLASATLSGIITASPGVSLWSSQTRRLSRFTSAAMVVMLGICLGPVYYRMVHPLQQPDSLPTSQGKFRELEDLVSQLAKLNPAESLMEKMEPEVKSKVDARYSRIHALVLGDFHAPDPMLDYQNAASLGQRMGAFRAWARCVDGEAKACVAKGDLEQACEYWMDSVRLGAGLGRGGSLSHTLSGLAFESIGLEGLTLIHNQLQTGMTAELVDALSAMESNRESEQSITRRTDLLMQRELGWRYRLAKEAAAWLSDQPQEQSGTLATGSLQATHDAIVRRDAMVRMLMTHLALRGYRADEGKSPSSLAELVPGWLPSVPLDPFSGRPVIYRLEESEGGGEPKPLVYCVGFDGTDDGGRFGGPASYYQAGMDVDLRTPVRNTAAAAGGRGGGMGGGGMGGGGRPGATALP